VVDTEAEKNEKSDITFPEEGWRVKLVKSRKQMNYFRNGSRPLMQVRC
jgi:hypothetical protein